MKVYTFLDEDENVIEEVRAEDHAEAVALANGWRKEGTKIITFQTDFYSDESYT